MFSVNPREARGRIIFTILIQKSEKQWNVLRVCLENLLTGGPSGNQTFLRGCTPQESLITLGTSLGQIFPDNLFRLSTVFTRATVKILDKTLPSLETCWSFWTQ